MTLACSAIAHRLGRTAGLHLGTKLELFGALVLIGLGIRVLVQHLL